MSEPEFSRPVRLDTLGGAPRPMGVEANDAERAALASRFGLVAIEALRAQAELSRSGETVRARGRTSAAVVQSCIASGEPVTAKIDEPFDIEFRPTPEGGDPDEEIELGESDLDVVFYSGSALDLGEAVAETLSLALDPYPRSPAAEAALREAGVKDEEEAQRESSPFAALAALKDKLGK